MRWTILAVFISLMIFPVASMSEEPEESRGLIEPGEELSNPEMKDGDKEDKDMDNKKRLRIKSPDLIYKGGSLEFDGSRGISELFKPGKLSPEGWGVWFGPDVMFFSPDLSNRLEPMTDELELDDFDDSLLMLGLRLEMTFGQSLAMGVYYQGGLGMEDELVDGEKHEASINMNMFGLSGQIQYPVMSQGLWEDLTGGFEWQDKDIMPGYPPRVFLGTRFGMGEMTLTARGDDLFEDTNRGTELLLQIAPYAGIMMPIHKWVRAETYIGYNYIEFTTGTADFEMDDEKMISGDDFGGLFFGITLTYGTYFRGEETPSESRRL